MKKLCAFLIFAVISVGANAQIWRVNNSDNSADFTNIQAAINDSRVTNDDTLFVEGSSAVYSEFTVNKRLNIIGPGYFLSVNPKTSASGLTSIIEGTAIFTSGSEGSTLSGLIFSSGSQFYRPSVRTDNITIMRCYLSNGLDIEGDINGGKIIQNFIEYYGVILGSQFYSFQGIELSNNIIMDDFSVASSGSEPRTFSEVNNNIFRLDMVLTTGVFRNNIWALGGQGSYSVTSGTKENNIVYNSVFGTENGNKGYVNLSELYQNQANESFDARWMIEEGSAFKNTGHDGTDPGPFGGKYPYVLSGTPPLPIIYELSTSGFGNQELGLPVTIRIRSNN